ncbi:TetR/AcrR family transcriptional regulator [Shimia sp. CNT1-13L.2]|uniref:TetR/AcrR family transcriptional regulator n=1 Tax=Shimia sp. CNT1-13L.2 TaxID=2959663 RepID=UPI0020CBA952|nr:TetR/AcrR family transcriptional regulator [Shimia sp. CNT1-13L.2]MCP9481987.1 TetR/AcrR family transcriptional regulator [Shimia sp. CNT1-13L.2]
MAGRPKKSSQHLSKSVILQAALPIVQSMGVDALSFRLIAEKLKVTPMAVTYHSGSKKELVAELVELAFHNTLHSVGGDCPAEKVRSILSAYFHRAVLNANLLRAVLDDVSLMGRELRYITNELQSCVRELGNGDHDNVLLHLLIDYTHGFVLSATSGSGATLSVDEYLRGVDWVLAHAAVGEGAGHSKETG